MNNYVSVSSYFDIVKKINKYFDEGDAPDDMEKILSLADDMSKSLDDMDKLFDKIPADRFKDIFMKSSSLIRIQIIDIMDSVDQIYHTAKK